MKKWKELVALIVVITAGVLLASGIAGRAAAGTGGEKDVTIKMTTGADPATTTLSKSRQERVRWYNTDARGHSIMFDFKNWPFLEPPEIIQIKAGEKSHWYTVYINQKNDKYSYEIVPAVETVPGKTTPPEGPSVSVGD